MKFLYLTHIQAQIKGHSGYIKCSSGTEDVLYHQNNQDPGTKVGVIKKIHKNHYELHITVSKHLIRTDDPITQITAIRTQKKACMKKAAELLLG